MKIILGSESLARKEILKKAGYTFSVKSPNINEKEIRTTDYKKLPLLLARAKMKALLPTIAEPSILVTADQVVVCNNELREKPESLEQARTYLESYTNYPAYTYTAVVVTNTKTHASKECVEEGVITFSPIPKNIITKIINQKKVMHAAGAFIFQDPLLKPYIASYVGEIETIIGLPLQATKQFIIDVQENGAIGGEKKNKKDHPTE